MGTFVINIMSQFIGICSSLQLYKLEAIQLLSTALTRSFFPTKI